MPVQLLLVQRLGPATQRALDLTIALASGALCWYAAASTPPVLVPEPSWLAVFTGVLFGAPILVRRRWPITVAVVIGVATAAVLALGVIPDYASPAPVAVAGAAAYTVGRVADGGTGANGVLVMMVLLVVGTAFSSGSAESPGLAGMAVALMVAGAGWSIGWALRERRHQAEETVRQNTLRAVAEERLRIARDMHDTVGHSLSLITVKSAIANHVARQRPEEVVAALAVIEAESRSALAELRRVVGALRTEPGYEPSPTLDDLRRLADNAESAGVSVHLEVRGCDDLPEPVALTVFRLVQESLTNVVRHAAPTSCQVDVESTGHELRISITDDGTRRPPTAARDGTGLVGMRERVVAYGGTFTAGPRSGGGFAVVATIPFGTVS
ncbi:sensor histidine kinase [Actinoplanes derwentensis]|uniref:histidine kinase n=1 Tax=Actinoplanes derwentensis TaxID=113562 RepID=A0A1H2ACA8_9ACTN|nr:sensor histidine kinase [Actinoplanes derwentensis]GID88947.1 two-component sensor histidine kinase [Actinoplanes derwentensis]SDT43578.1 Signal transduction histidine kinase [Actinoplanes derwentensis]